MSLPVANYAFLPWLRRGLGADVARVDGTPGAAPRASLPIAVRFNQNDAQSGGVELALFGPGEVKGLDARTVVRTCPRANVMDAEPNYFALIEFDQADLPWRYTPARATAGDRLTPWVALVVLADDEIDALAPPSGHDLGRVQIKNAAVLPKWSQLWAWAHVQYAGGTELSAPQAEALLAAGSPFLTSRSLCARRLKPRTGYRALLVPTFQRGVLAGLGQPVPDAVDALTPAWTDDASSALTLPVYYEWRFGTGTTGDFEALARLLKPFEAPASIGIRPMDVSAASPGMPPAASTPLGLQGALRALGTVDTAWLPADRAAWVAALRPLLNLPAERRATPGLPLTVTPPLYGQWPAAANRSEADDPNALPAWFQALSVDPRFRVGAALGTQVVQLKQESLMASAWEQVDRVRQLNEELRQAQLAREVAERVALRHVLRADTETTLVLTAPLHARLTASPKTIRQVLRDSPIPPGALEPALRRLARPRGGLGRRQGRPGAILAPLLARLNTGALTAAGVPPVPSGMATAARLGTGLALGETAASLAARRRLTLFGLLLALLLLVLAVVCLFFAPALALVVAGAALGFGVFALRQRSQNEHLALEAALRDGTLTGYALRTTAPASDFVPQAAPATGAPRTLPDRASATASSAPPIAVAEFQAAAAALFDRLAPPTEPLRIAREAKLGDLRTTLATKLAPAVTFAAAYRQRFVLAKGVVWQPDDPIEPINAAPEFPQPMYQELKRLSPDWLLPGLSAIPTNTVTLLKTNQAMVEAFMVGLNHEMARELLWREYPVEQRASCFRQFWDVQGTVVAPGTTVNPDTQKDITPIHTWPKRSGLGSHSPRPPVPGGGDYLVLLIRGDLLRRYPNTLVYAARARWRSDGLREIDDPSADATAQELAAKQSWPLFSGELQPDACFFGFALSATEVRGSSDPSGDPGWFFVLQEHSHEPRFGLDEADGSSYGQPVVATWDNLAWSALAPDANALSALTRVDLNAELPDTRQISSTVTKRWHADSGKGTTGSRSSDLAFITFQRPMRVGIHGEDMIP